MRFGGAHDLTHVDVARGARERQPAAAAARALNPTLLDQALHDLHEVMLRNTVRSADFRERDSLSGVRGQVEQDAQRVIRKERELHDDWG